MFIGGDLMIIDITKLKQSLLTSIEVNEDVFVSKEELNKDILLKIFYENNLLNIIGIIL